VFDSILRIFPNSLNRERDSAAGAVATPASLSISLGSAATKEKIGQNLKILTRKEISESAFIYLLILFSTLLAGSSLLF